VRDLGRRLISIFGCAFLVDCRDRPVRLDFVPQDVINDLGLQDRCSAGLKLVVTQAGRALKRAIRDTRRPSSYATAAASSDRCRAYGPQRQRSGQRALGRP